MCVVYCLPWQMSTPKLPFNAFNNKARTVWAVWILSWKVIGYFNIFHYGKYFLNSFLTLRFTFTLYPVAFNSFLNSANFIVLLRFVSMCILYYRFNQMSTSFFYLNITQMFKHVCFNYSAVFLYNLY